MTRKKTIILSSAALLLMVFIIWMIWSNVTIKTTVITVTSSKLGNGFDGFRIAQVSDLHNSEFGEGNIKLLDKLKKAEPDIIAITGDIADHYHNETQIAIDFAKKAVEIAPCYYIVGNHEVHLEDKHILFEELEKTGVIMLRNCSAELKSGDDAITIWGTDDPVFDDSLDDIEKRIGDVGKQKEGFTLLLSHRPEYFERYVESGIDLVLSGHAHGGQARLPFMGGIIAPGQGLFPEYDSGLYKKEYTQMVVSRGLGNSAFPIRFNNRPELVLIDLNKE